VAEKDGSSRILFLILVSVIAFAVGLLGLAIVIILSTFGFLSIL